MTLAGIFCKPRYNAQKSQMLLDHEPVYDVNIARALVASPFQRERREVRASPQ
jgi:hypothetical protein